jgi:hypothetical protein
MPWSRIDSSRRAVRWLLPAAALSLTPKCLLCLGAYLGLGALVGLSGPEFCGAAPNTLPVATGFVFSLAVAASVVFAWRLRRRLASTGTKLANVLPVKKG